MNQYDKMRDALMQVSLSCSACPRHNCKGCTRPFASFMPTVRKALSLPRRNCDVGTPEEQGERCMAQFDQWRRKGDGKKLITAIMAWAQAPYAQEGGAK